MPKYVAKTPIKFKRDRYEEGEDIELSDKEAKPLLAMNPPAIEAPGAAAKKDKDK